MNLNNFAKKVALIEGKKKSISIAQVKEVLKITFTELGKCSDNEILQVINKYRG